MRDQELTEALAHYASLAREPGWKAYVWHRVQQMAEQQPGLYAELPARLVETMKHEIPQPPHHH